MVKKSSPQTANRKVKLAEILSKILKRTCTHLALLLSNNCLDSCAENAFYCAAD